MSDAGRGARPRSREEGADLRRLRRRLTLLCAGMTGLVLAGMAVAALGVAESQIRQASAAAFQSNINSIVAKLQNDGAVSNSWLAQVEAAEGLVIHIEDNGTPLLFRGAWDPPTPRAELAAAARATALADYGVDLGGRPASMLSTVSAVFSQRGAAGERYLAAAVAIPSARGWQSLVLLRDMRDEDRSIGEQRALFLLLVLAGVAVLVAWSWFFVGRTLRPIGESRRRQVSFVAAASHELRSPLAVIRASASVLRAGGDVRAGADIGRFAGNIERECGRMGRLVDDLLLLAGSDAQTWTVSPRPVDLDVLLVETAELFYPVAARKRQSLRLALPDEGLPEVQGDGERLRQVLAVLLDNALGYTPEGGAVVLRAAAEGRCVRIEVADSGPGIPPEHAAHIFERFYRADSARNDKAHFGLGLSIAQELVRLHRGRLTLAQTGPAGATFRLELPV